VEGRNWRKEGTGGRKELVEGRKRKGSIGTMAEGRKRKGSIGTMAEGREVPQGREGISNDLTKYYKPTDNIN